MQPSIDVNTFVELVINPLDQWPGWLRVLKDPSDPIVKSVKSAFDLMKALVNLVGRNVALMLIWEWPEVVELALKLFRDEKLGDGDEAWLSELAQEAGWSREDLIEELKSVDADPSSRVKRYEELFEKYRREALELVGKDSRQAGEKMWGAVTALIKLHAAKKGVPIIHWDHGKLHSYVNNNVEREDRELFQRLLLTAEELHVHFYEGHLDESSFKEYFSKVAELIEKVGKLIDLK
jgi:hypothetical protein